MRRWGVRGNGGVGDGGSGPDLHVRCGATQDHGEEIDSKLNPGPNDPPSSGVSSSMRSVSDRATHPRPGGSPEASAAHLYPIQRTLTRERPVPLHGSTLAPLQLRNSWRDATDVCQVNNAAVDETCMEAESSRE